MNAPEKFEQNSFFRDPSFEAPMRALRAVQAPSEAQQSEAKAAESRHMAVKPHERQSEALQVFPLYLLLNIVQHTHP